MKEKAKCQLHSKNTLLGDLSVNNDVAGISAGYQVRKMINIPLNVSSIFSVIKLDNSKIFSYLLVLFLFFFKKKEIFTYIEQIFRFDHRVHQYYKFLNKSNNKTNPEDDSSGSIMSSTNRRRLLAYWSTTNTIQPTYAILTASRTSRLFDVIIATCIENRTVHYATRW